MGFDFDQGPGELVCLSVLLQTGSHGVATVVEITRDSFELPRCDFAFFLQSGWMLWDVDYMVTALLRDGRACGE